jgi:CheY-like chemotaxis protein
MEDPFYDLADVVVCDPVTSNRAATRSALHTLGCRRIEIVADLNNLRDALEEQHPDLALCEISAGAQELCKLIQEVRQDGNGYNPFVAFIITAWTVNADLLAQISNSGADDLLLRPFSTALLGQRIESLVDRRKRFVVSLDYVGPERREVPRSVSNVVLMNPPNSIKIKALARAKSRDIAGSWEAELQSGRLKLNMEKSR